MSLYTLQGAVEEGFIYALVAIGLYISYEILNIADMTTDGSFVLGGAISSIFVIMGKPVFALLFAFIAGALAGFVTAFQQNKLGIPSILAGIISMTGLYSVNLFIQSGSPELFYKNSPTIFSLASKFIPKQYTVIVTLLVLIVLTVAAINYFFSTQLGLSIRATGDNINMVQSSSINPNFTISIGLMLSNGFVALAGAMLSQRDTKSNINAGVGIVVIGLAGLVIGKLLFRSNKTIFGIIGAVLGSIVYRIILSFAIRYADPGYLKIVSALIVAVVISYPKIKSSVKDAQNRSKRGDTIA